MIDQDLGFDGIDGGYLKMEKQKARKMRKTSWWQRKLAQGCYYCGQQFSPKELTMDHIVPLARGGSSSKGNLVAACKECNTKKHSLLPIEWEEYMATIG